MGVGQEFTFSPILSALYITPIFHILEKKIFQFLFQFLLCFLLMVVFLFLRKKALKNQIQISFIVIVLFLLFLDNLVLS